MGPGTTRIRQAGQLAIPEAIPGIISALAKQINMLRTTMALLIQGTPTLSKAMPKASTRELGPTVLSFKQPAVLMERLPQQQGFPLTIQEETKHGRRMSTLISLLSIRRVSNTFYENDLSR